jgi:anion transporter
LPVYPFCRQLPLNRELFSIDGRTAVTAAKIGLRVGWQECWVVAALAAYALARLSPPLESLSPQGQAVLGAMAAGAILWISEATPIGVTAIVVTVLLALSPGAKLADAVGGFASEVVFFLIGAVAIGTAVEVSGLAARAARFLGRMARGSPARLYVQMIGSLPAFAILVPSAITRNAILIPAYEEALDRMGIGKTDRSGRMLMLALGVLNPLASSALLTGGLASITAASLLGGFSWLRWFALMAVPYYALLFGGALLLRCVVGPFEPAQRASTPPPAAAPAQPFIAIEIKTLAVLAGTLALWLTDRFHHLSPAIPALIGAAVLLLPKIGVLSWKTFEAKLSWGIILSIGAALSLAAAMTKTGAAAFVSQSVVSHLAGLADRPTLLVIGLILAVALIHLAITNLAACIALLIPVAATIAERAALNPIVCGLIVTIVVDAVILYPIQTATNLLAYETGYYGAADVRRLGIGMLVLTMVVILLTIPYWGLLGLPLTLH